MPRKSTVKEWNRMAPESLPGERRTRRRYALNIDLSYRIQEGAKTVQSGNGITCDLSSTGIRFITQEKLQDGGSVELTLPWPKMERQGPDIVLRVSGRLVRNFGNEAVVRMDRHEFFSVAAR